MARGPRWENVDCYRASPTGATRLDEAVGMHVGLESVVCERVLG
jgi:hypothetical protein